MASAVVAMVEEWGSVCLAAVTPTICEFGVCKMVSIPVLELLL